MTIRSARAWHALTAIVAIGALVFQLVLVIQGGRVLDETEPARWSTGCGTSSPTSRSRATSWSRSQRRCWPAIRSGTGPASARSGSRARSASPSRASSTSSCSGRCSTSRAPTSSPTSCCTWSCRCSRSSAGRSSARGRGSTGGEIWSVLPGRWPGSAGRSSWARPAAGTPTRSSTIDEKGWGHVLGAIVGITAFFLVFIAGASAIDRRVKPAPEEWDPYRGGTAQP